jgi:hypothetical protein
MLVKMNRGEGLADALQGALDAAEGPSPVEAVEAVTRELGLWLGAADASFLMADFVERSLVRLAHIPLGEEMSEGHDLSHVQRRDSGKPASALPYDDGPAGQAMRTQTVQVLPPAIEQPGTVTAGPWTVLAPVTERGETIGLLELLLPQKPGADIVADATRAGHLLALVVITARRHTDLFGWERRGRPFTLAAEIQHRLLPGAYTCATAGFTLSAWLEPADHVGGDTFDYSVSPDVLHLSVVDAMGHGVTSALTASICAGNLRATRRQGASLLAQATHTNAAMADHAARVGDEGFCTALLGRLNLRTQVLELLDAGHVGPYLARSGMVSAVELPVSLPLGLFADTTYTTTSLTMQPGDRLVIVTDGMLEHDAATVDLVATINQTRLLHPTQTARFLTDRVLEAAGDDLADDATVLVLDWHGPPTQANTITNPTSLSETALTPSSTRPQPQQ